MKKVIVFGLALVLLLSLCACGKSGAVKNVEEQISAISETNPAEEAVDEALKAYEALEENEKKNVENYAVLQKLQDIVFQKEFQNLKRIIIELNSNSTVLANKFENLWKNCIRMGINVAEEYLEVGFFGTERLTDEEYKKSSRIWILNIHLLLRQYSQEAFPTKRRIYG